ncbi:hypothetical protein AB0M87_21080 [Streptomyces sp. NPDC051320]|uniref:hypothetical protein n=1 Tax=Streptomyces sp. NPDC051320 TaxID=3154644 RepID=UPI003447B894
MNTSTSPAGPARALTGRTPERLLRPERLAVLPPTRLSAGRALVNRMIGEGWTISCPEFDVDARARGRVRYRVHTPKGPLDFVAFSFEPKLTGRTSRIVGTDWDMTGALFDGTASEAVLERTRHEIPKLYGGRATPDALIWCRSNRSLRLFEHVVDALADGRAPDADRLWDVGYLMRNTGLDGNGTFGTRSFLALPDDHPLSAPLHAQMLAAYLMREFAVDLAEHLARHRAAERGTPGRAARLDPRLRRSLGLGNASALGLVFFANNHPRLIDRWLCLREEALAAALTARRGAGHLAAIGELIARTARFHEQDTTVYGVFEAPDKLASALRTALSLLEELPDPTAPDALAHLWQRWNETLDEPAVESLAGILIDSVPDLTDALVDRQRVDENLRGRPEEPVARLLATLEEEYSWALEMDLTTEASRRHVWYKSAAAEEPRRGPRTEVPDGADWGLNVPRAVQSLAAALRETRPQDTVGVFCARRPEHRDTVVRVQALAGTLLHSPHMNISDAAFMPVHLVRFVNSAVHGLDKTADSADRNVLGLLFHGAPGREELGTGVHADWTLPVRPVPEAPARLETGNEDTGELRVSVRELRLMTERVLMTTTLPAGSVGAAREIVADAQIHHSDGLAGLLADLPALRDPAARPHLALAPDLLDLAVARALGGETHSVGVPGPRPSWALAALPIAARRRGVRLTITDEALTADADPDPAPGPEATGLEAPGLEAPEEHALREGLPVPLDLWQRVVAEADSALTPDSPLSRTHAGDSVFGPDGEILAEVGEDEIEFPTALEVTA